MQVTQKHLVTLLCLFLAACVDVPVKSPKVENNKASAINVQTKPLDTVAQAPIVEKLSNPVKDPVKEIIPITRKPPIRKPAIFTELPSKVKQILAKNKVSSKGLSVYIQALDNDRPLLSFNADIPRNPASVMKLITTYTSLGTLGADYRWLIELYTDGNINGDTLNGNLILKGYGYPDFKIADLRQLLQGLRAQGIIHIAGNLVFDNTYFDLGKQDSGAFDGSPHAYYNAMPDALMYNERLSDFVVQAKSGKAVIYSPHPARNIQIVNQVKVRNVSCKGKYASPGFSIRSEGNIHKAVFQGTLSSRCGARNYKSVISDPENMLFAGIRNIWIQEMQGTIQGNQFIIQVTPKDARLIYGIKSKPVSEVLPLINKKSNNVMARQLFLSIAAKKAGMPATNVKGATAIKSWLFSRGLDFPELVMENGSGLSRIGAISVRHMAEMLIDAYKSSNQQVFLNSLPIMGVDGTLRNRMKHTIVAGQAHMKTGTLSNVRGIAGYVNSTNGSTYVVAILHNDPKARYSTRTAHDELIQWTATQAPRLLNAVQN